MPLQVAVLESNQFYVDAQLKQERIRRWDQGTREVGHPLKLATAKIDGRKKESRRRQPCRELRSLRIDKETID